MTRLAHDPRTKAYAARRTAEGKTKKEIIRCLKRYIAREIYKALCRPQRPGNARRAVAGSPPRAVGRARAWSTGLPPVRCTADLPAAGNRRQREGPHRWLAAAGWAALRPELAQVSPGALRREVPAKRGAVGLWRRSRAGVSGGGCAARAPAGTVTGSRVAGDVPGVQPWRRRVAVGLCC